MNRLQAIQNWQDNYVKIPEGWRKIQQSEKIFAGDKYHVVDKWIDVEKDDSRIGMRCSSDVFTLHITSRK